MPDFAMDYGILNEARKDLHDLADRISPTLSNSIFSQLGSGNLGDAQAVFGDPNVTNGFRSLYRLSKDPMNRAVDHLKQLGDVFGAVADGYFDVDAQISDGLGVMGANMGLDAWRGRKSAWDYRNAHADQCTPDEHGKVPEFCSATDPGAPPVDQTINTANGSVHTHLTLDGNNNVVKEETTVTHDGQTYTSTTSYTDNGKSFTTDTVYSDGTKNHAETHLHDDGTGDMTVTDNDGVKTEYHRGGPGQEWQQTGGGKPEDSSDDSSYPPVF
ncbi:hypothetical protein ACFRKE_07155 [Kitasatospora indigofera]|uniref:Uncharacterized protein n=1 Tax=Kitasatospora indigofera TaxID=67307 RepID=A0A919G1K1_9ACTN|nr:hypothetical protein [Kitasatospora indigofera]GHH75510.1 hypothetical protein GCM10018781_44500 [Kitasatospora indigofera]